MHATVLKVGGREITTRVLRNGDTATVQRVFEGLGERSRRLRFGAAKPRLSSAELATLARVDANHHVLVASIGVRPVGIAHLVRDDDPRAGELAIAVADEWQRSGIGRALVELMTRDAAVAGMRHIRSHVRMENRAMLSLLERATTVVTRQVQAGGELQLWSLTASA